MRRLNAKEEALVTRLASGLDDTARTQLLEDLPRALAEPATTDNSRILFEIAGYERPAYHGQHRVGAEARMRDRDDEALSVVLYADENGRLLELEFIRWATGDLLDPQWDTLEFI